MFFKKEKSVEEMELDALFEELKTWDKTSDEYKNLLGKWMDLRKALDERKRADKVKPDTWASIGANLAIVMAVLNFEKLNNISTKALSFIKKV